MSLRAGRRTIHEILVVKKARDPRISEALRLARDRKIPYRYCFADEINRLVPGIRHQGIAIRASALPELTVRDLAYGAEDYQAVLVALDQVQDPHNLGAVIRVADAVGATGLIIPETYAAGITPTIARTSAGSVETLPVVTVPNLITTLRELQMGGFCVVGTDTESDASYWAVEAQQPLCLVFGNEAQGLRRRVRDLCDLVVQIPIAGYVESLNVSVAAGIVLYEVMRQREGTLIPQEAVAEP